MTSCGAPTRCCGAIRNGRSRRSASSRTPINWSRVMAIRRSPMKSAARSSARMQRASGTSTSRLRCRRKPKYWATKPASHKATRGSSVGPVPDGAGPINLSKNGRRREVPTYEYTCDSCRVIYQTRHGIKDPRPEHCPKCKGKLRKVLSAPSLNTRNHSSPTQAKYAKVSESAEIAKEKDLQQGDETVWTRP